MDTVVYSLRFNALNLTVGANLSDMNTFWGIISDMRARGYASNRLDYICHSMGGSVLRTIFDNYYALFTRTAPYANAKFKNYERGYVNKVIMIGLPNNSFTLLQKVV